MPAQPDLEPADEQSLFTGHQPRECGEHRTVGPHRAWCFDCGEWCYPAGDMACKGCRIPMLAEAAASDAPVVWWIVAGSGATNLGRHVLNAAHAAAFAKWWPAIEANGGLLPAGLYEDLAGIVEGYAQVAVREALSKENRS